MFARMPQAPTRLKKSRDEARRLLRERMDKAVEIDNDIRSQQELQKAVAREKLWREYNCQLLDTIFTTPEYADEYRASVLPLFSVADRYFPDPGFETLKSRLVASITSQIAKLVSIINRLELVEEESAAPRSGQPPDKARWLVTLAERFHLVARQMLKRHAGRAGFELKDEYDVQDLFHALLTIFFDDIRKEEWTPSYAGGTGRMDFLLPELKAVVELKMMRPSLSTKELGDQLLVDIARYQVHPGCRTLYCIVYDPDGLISNPRGVEADLSRQHGDLVVQVMIVPRGT
jgi:hypothetical protein